MSKSNNDRNSRLTNFDGMVHGIKRYYFHYLQFLLLIVHNKANLPYENQYERRRQKYQAGDYAQPSLPEDQMKSLLKEWELNRKQEEV